MRTMFYESLKEAAGRISRPKLAKAFMSRGDVAKLLSEKFGPVSSSNGCNGVELITTCPFCGHAGKLSVNPSKGVYHCWHCDSSGGMRNLLGVSVTMVSSPSDEPQSRKEDRIVYPPSFDPSKIVPLSSLPEDSPAIVYLKSRGFDPAELERDFAFRYCSSGRRFPGAPFDASNTIVIPVYSESRCIGWQCRLLYDPKKVSDEVLMAMGYTDRKDSGDLKRPPKYMTSPGLNKREVLYNVDWAKQFDTVVVTEGVFDCVRVGRQGVATFGKGVSDAQRKMLTSMWKTIVLLLDPDAEKAQEDLARSLTAPGGPRIVKVALEGYKDAGECPRDELWRQIGAALN